MTNLLRLIRLFFRPHGLDFAQAGGGIASGLTDIYDANRLPYYTGFVPGAANEMDAKFYNAMQAIQAATDRNTGMVDPVLLQSYSGMLGIDLSGLITSGQLQGQQYGALAGQAAGSAGALMDQAGRTLSAGQDIYQLGRDPQNQLHDYLKGQTIDTSRAADSARGIAMGDVSAGNESDAVRKFEMDWQNQQLARALQGEQGLTAAGYYGGQNLSGAMGFGQQVPQLTGASFQAPIQGQTAYYQMPMNFSSMFTGAENQNVIGPQANLQGQIMPYLGLGAQAGSNQAYYGLNRGGMNNQMQVQGAGMFNTGYSTGMGYNHGSESGMGKPENWVSMGGGGGGGGGGGMGGGMWGGGE